MNQNRGQESAASSDVLDGTGQHRSNDKAHHDATLSDIGFFLLRGKMTILISTILTTVIAIAYALLATPIYRAELLMVPSRGDDNSGASLTGLLSGLDLPTNLIGAGLGDDSGNTTNTALAILESRQFTERFIEEQNLMPVLFADQWDAEAQAWKRPGWFDRIVQSAGEVFTEPVNSARIGDGPTSWSAYKLVREKMLKVSVEKATGLITLSIDWKDPQVASDWANKAVATVNDVIRQQDVDEAERSVQFLKEQMTASVPYEIKQAFYSLIVEHTKVIMLADARPGYAFKVIDRAVPPQIRVWPARTMIVMVGFFLGLIIGSLVAVRRGANGDRGQL